MATAAELRTEVVAFARGLDPEVLSGAQAAAIVRELAVIEKAAATARMFAAVRVAKTDAWRGQGHASPADWLAAQCGMTVARAAAQLRTGRQAADLPKTKRAMQEGDLSPEQAESVASASTADPQAEDELLRAAADETAAALRRKADAARAAATDAAERERRVRRERSVRYRNDAEGAFCLTLRGPGADGVALLSLLRPFEEEAFASSRRRERDGGERDTHENRTYDAFQALLASLAGSVGAGARTTEGRRGAGGGPGREAGGHDAGVRGPGAGPARARVGSAPADASVRARGGDNVKVIVRVDLAALRRGHAVAGETCEIDGVGPLSAEAVRRLLLEGDPFVAAVLQRGRNVQRVVHLGRGLSAHQRTAIEAVGLRCSNVACNKTVGMQIDHREPWATDPRTVLANQDPLCPDCHRRKTHHGWRLEPGTGPRRFRPPDDPARSDGSPARAPARSSGPPGEVEQPTLC
ncbi:MAG: HNH endonuclease signature motif containing protein [Acidimicrobiales bacterium]